MKIDLRVLKVKDVTIDYVNWFKDKDVTRYSDNQYKNFTLYGQKKYVKECLSDKNKDLYGIFFKKRHIGNVCVSLNSIHKRAEISYVVGVKTLRGKGVGALAIKKVIRLTKKKYKIKKITAGLANSNSASKRVLEKNNFILEGIRKKHLFYNNNFYDQLDYSLNFR